VVSANADEILKQWRDVHGLPEQPASEGQVNGHRRQAWRDSKGEDVIESFTIAGMAHGTPLATGDGDDAYGAAGPFLLDVGISSTYHIARFWGLTDEARAAAGDVAFAAPSGTVELATPADRNRSAPPPRPGPRAGENTGASLPIDIQAVIDRALKAAGLKA
jgi:hypothetical protein